MGPTAASALRSLYRSWKPLLAAAVVGALAGVSVWALLPSHYRATAYLLGGKVGPDPIDSTLLIGESTVYARVATDPGIMGPAIRAAGLPFDPVHLRRFVTAATDPNSPLLAITASTAHPGQAAQLANVVAARMTTYSQGFANDTGYELIPFAKAIPPAGASGPGVIVWAAAGAALAIMVGLLVVVVREDDTAAVGLEAGAAQPAERDTPMAMLRGRWKLVTAVIILGIAVGIGTGVARSPTYRTTSYLIGVRSGVAPIDAQLLIGESKAFTRVVDDSSVVGPALDRAGVHIAPNRLRTRFGTTTDTNDPLLGITASAGGPAEAARLADIVATSVSTYSGTLASKTGYQLNVFAQAALPTAPVGPGTGLLAALGAVIGIVVAVVIVFVVPEMRRAAAPSAPPT